MVFFINTGIPITLYSNLLTFRDTNRSFKLDIDILISIKNYDFNVDHSNWQDRERLYEIGKEMKNKNKQKRRKIPIDESFIRRPKSPVIMVSGDSTIFFPSDHKELCDRSKLLLQNKQAGNISTRFNDEILAIVDNSLEFKSKSKKKHKQILIKCNL